MDPNENINKIILDVLKKEKTEQQVNTHSKGYSRKQLRKIEMCHHYMNLKLKALLEPYLLDSVSLMEPITSPAQVELFQKYEKLWRDYIRDQVIPEYPGAKSSSERRLILMGIFERKVEELHKTALKDVLTSDQIPGEPSV